MNATAAPCKTQDVLASSDVDLLVAYLLDEEEVQSQLHRKLGEKERYLVKQDLDALETCLRETEPVVKRLEICTHRRVRILRALGGRLGMQPEEIQISSLLERCSDQDRLRLEEARNRLRDVLVQIGNQNRRNHVLIKNGIELNESLVMALFGRGEVRRTYDHTAKTQTIQPSISYLNQEL